MSGGESIIGMVVSVTNYLASHTPLNPQSLQGCLVSLRTSTPPMWKDTAEASLLPGYRNSLQDMSPPSILAARPQKTAMNALGLLRREKE